MHNHGSDTSQEGKSHSFHAKYGILSKEFRRPGTLLLASCDALRRNMVHHTHRVVALFMDLLKVIMVIAQTTKSTIMFMTYIIMITGLYCRADMDRELQFHMYIQDISPC